MDDRVGADGHVRADVGRGRIDDRHAGRHQLVVLRRSQNRRHVGQLPPAVHAEDLARSRSSVTVSTASPRVAVNPHEVRQVVLALRVGRADLAQRREQRLQLERVDAAVDLADLALGRRRVLVLDDGRQSVPVRRARSARSPPAIGTTAVSTVAAAPRASCVLTRARKRRRRAAAARRPRATPPCRSRPARCGSACSKRMPGAELRLLHCKGEARPAPKGVLQLLGLVADDDDGRRRARGPTAARRTCSIRGRPAAPMQHLGHARTSCACLCRRRGSRRGCRTSRASVCSGDEPARGPRSASRGRRARRRLGGPGGVSSDGPEARRGRGSPRDRDPGGRASDSPGSSRWPGGGDRGPRRRARACSSATAMM